MFVFDSDYLSLLKRYSGREAGMLLARITQYPQEAFFVSIISFHEQVKGWQNYIAKARDQQGIIRGYAELESLLHDYAQAQVLPFGESASEIFDDFRKSKVRVGTMDLRIASVTMASGMTLLTRNTVDFERVPGLSFETWI